MSPLTKLQNSVEGSQLRFRGNRVAEVLLIPSSEYQVEPLLQFLSPDQQARQQRFQNPGRQKEYVTSRWLLRQLSLPGNQSISHCRQWLAVASSGTNQLGIDVESRLPRQIKAVSERLGWDRLDKEDYLQAWTLWEAWRKLEGGSVLDEPDEVYRDVLTQRKALFKELREVSGVCWFSRQLNGGCLSLAVRLVQGA